MKEVMHRRFVPSHYKRDLFKKLQELRQGMRTVDEYYKEMEVSMIRANVLESEEQAMARFLNGLNYPIKKIVEFQPYNSLVTLVHQATKAERQILEDAKYAKQKAFFASKPSSPTPPMAQAPPTNAKSATRANIKAPQTYKKPSPQATNQASTQVKSSSITCFKCGGSGHTSFECVNNKVMIVNADGLGCAGAKSGAKRR